MALSSLRPRYHALVFTVDVTQWRGAHSFWPCSGNILEHSGCSSGTPGALYLNNIILYNAVFPLEFFLCPVVRADSVICYTFFTGC